MFCGVRGTRQVKGSAYQGMIPNKGIEVLIPISLYNCLTFGNTTPEGSWSDQLTRESLHSDGTDRSGQGEF